jgi:2-polyprenyl-3-methyl-5-hydroxy-6-metoxy-1,4-benzoquinol methylase
MEIEKEKIFYEQLCYQNDPEYVRDTVIRNLLKEELIDKDVLDFGCGSGCVSFFMKQFDPKSVTAIDISKKNILVAEAKKKQNMSGYGYINFIEADLDQYDIGENKFDLIWADTVIELLSKPLGVIVENIHKALREKGVFYISFPKKTFSNMLFCLGLRGISFLHLKRFKKFFYYLILPKYYFAKISGKIMKIDKKMISEKVEYLFVPHIQLISKERIEKEMNKAGFVIKYTRDRIKSDVNSIPHLEIKAVKR